MLFILEVIHETQGKSVLSDIQTLRSRLKKRGAAEFFLKSNFEVFGYLIKHFYIDFV